MCGKTKGTIQLDALAKRVHKAIDQYFQPVPYVQFYLRKPFGLAEESQSISIGDLVSHFVVSSRAIVDDLLALVARHADQIGEDHGIERLYEYDSSFVFKRDPAGPRLYHDWNMFEQKVRSHRTGKPNVAKVLMELFGDLNDYTTFGNESVVRERTPEDTTFEIWRGRLALSMEQAAFFLDLPSEQIGPPPQTVEGDEVRPPAGRMNRKGVSVFYGASNLDTCVAELRPPVGSYVVAAQFKLEQTVELLDLDSLADILEGSLFTDDFFRTSTLARFLRHLVARLSRPILPHEEEQEYIPTQIVAEFLECSSTPRLQGVTYRSSQRGSSGSPQTPVDDYNIVLFNSASKVKPYNPSFEPGSGMYVPNRGFLKVGDYSAARMAKATRHGEGDQPDGFPFLSIVPERLVLIDVQGTQHDFAQYFLHSRVYDASGQKTWTPL